MAVSLCRVLYTEALSPNSEGLVELYHYSTTDSDQILLEPFRITHSPNAYSRREAERSNVPRTFFYVDPSQREVFFTEHSHKLYSAKVPAASIYNLKQDPEGLIEAARNQYGVIDFNKLLMSISGWERGPSGKYTDYVKRSDGHRYDGCYYTAGGIDMVIWFEPVMVTRVPDDVRRQLELGI